MGRTLGLHLHTFPRLPNGATEYGRRRVVREGKNFQGRMLGIVLGIFGKRVLGKALGTTVKAVEARNYGARNIGTHIDAAYRASTAEARRSSSVALACSSPPPSVAAFLAGPIR